MISRLSRARLILNRSVVSLQTVILIFGINLECNRFTAAWSIDGVLVRFLAVKRRYRIWSDCCILSIVL